MNFTDHLDRADYLTVMRCPNDFRFTVRNGGDEFHTYLTHATSRAFALEILRLCGDEQPAPADKVEPKATKAIVMRRTPEGQLSPDYNPIAHDSVPDAIAAARRLAELSYNATSSFIVFTPVAEAKATVTVDLSHTPTI